MIIRRETNRDVAAIRAITLAAFSDHPYSNAREHILIEALRQAQALTLSLVAETSDGVVGHIAFSPVAIAGMQHNWFGLGPLAVLPTQQRRGIGSNLVRQGLAQLQELGARGCVLVGEPEFYRRFGFAPTPALQLEGIPPSYFLALAFAGEMPQGLVTYHPAFAEVA